MTFVKFYLLQVTALNMCKSLSSRNIFALIKRPKLLFKYLLRERNLTNFLGCERGVVNKYLLEANQITRDMLRLVGNSELGTILSPLRGPIVYVCVRVLKPNLMIETGVASGSSTYYILHAMELNQKGVLYSIDLPNADEAALVPKDKEIGWLVPLKLRHRWKLILGQSQERLPPLLNDLGTIDAFLHDSEHTYDTMMFEYENAYSHLRKGGLLLSDDIYWNKAFQDFFKKYCLKRWIIFDGLGAVLA